MGEVEEFQTSLYGDDQFRAYVEAVDVANMAFLCGLWCIEVDRPTFKEAKKP